MTTAMVNGVQLYYETTGTGDCLVLTHGSWTDGTGWDRAVAQLAHRYQVVVWDRRGHSRSQAGDGPGSRAEDAADLAGLIEHVSGEPVHVAGNSYGAIVTLTLLTARPDLVATATVHEPPLWGLHEGTRDQHLVNALSAADADLAVVRELIRCGEHRNAAEHFIEHVALGPGRWDQLPESFRAVLEANAPTYLDEMDDETALSIDTAALATTTVPLAVPCRDRRAREARAGGASGSPRGCRPHPPCHPPRGVERSPHGIPRAASPESAREGCVTPPGIAASGWSNR
jgi:pimeloyl-ACP methyl ester carboxylesterase